nr:hypothetical protein [Chitinophaga dinghuensis]
MPEAWGSGPVYPAFADKYDDDAYLENQIKPELPVGMDLTEATRVKLQSLQLEERQSRFIHDIINAYGKLDLGFLGYLTYGEAPWLNARAGLGFVGRGRKITFRAMYAHFHGGKVRREKLAEKEKKAQERKNAKGVG